MSEYVDSTWNRAVPMTDFIEMYPVLVVKSDAEVVAASSFKSWIGTEIANNVPPADQALATSISISTSRLTFQLNHTTKQEHPVIPYQDPLSTVFSVTDRRSLWAWSTMNHLGARQAQIPWETRRLSYYSYFAHDLWPWFDDSHHAHIESWIQNIGSVVE